MASISFVNICMIDRLSGWSNEKVSGVKSAVILLLNQLRINMK
jgi:hypothetical protein